MTSGSRETMFIIVYFFSIILISTAHPHDEEVVHEVDDESHLFFHLLDDHHYVRHIRPAAGENDTLTIKLSVTLTSIADLDERSQELVSNILLKAEWRDPRLTWNATQYHGVATLRVPASHIWKPDFTMLHSLYGSFEHLATELAIISDTGDVQLSSHYNVRSRCSVDIADFPFDSHACHVTLVDTTYSSQQIKLDFIDQDDSRSGLRADLPTVVSSQWEIAGRSQETTLGRLLHPDIQDYVSIEVRLHRKPHFYRCVVISPAVLISLLVPVLFLMPVDSSGKTILGSTLIISLMISLKLLCDLLESNRSSAPRVAMFYVATIALCSLSVILAAVVSSTAKRRHNQRHVPGWMQRVFLGRYGLRRCLCMQPETDNQHTTNFESIKSSGDFSENESDVTPLKEGESDLKEVSRHLRQLVGRYTIDQTCRDIDHEWREIALVIDRLLFLVFVILFLLTSLSLLS